MIRVYFVVLKQIRYVNFVHGICVTIVLYIKEKTAKCHMKRHFDIAGRNEKQWSTCTIQHDTDLYTIHL